MNLTLTRESLLDFPELLNIFVNIVQEDADFLRSSYPNYDIWLTTKVLPGIAAGERTVVVELRNNRPVGLLILKHTKDERKLCTLRVRPEFEFQGVGIRLFKIPFDILQTSRPLLSVSEVALPKFSKIFDHFGFAFEKSYQGLYLPKVHELAYNGILINDSNYQGIFGEISNPNNFIKNEPMFY